MNVMKRIRVLVAAFAVVLGLNGLVPAVALAAAPTPQSSVCGALGAGSNCSTPPNTVSINSVITATVNILSFVIGVVAVIMIMVAGFKYITANGDGNSVTSAKNTIVYAIIGLVIAALSQSLVRFVLVKLK